MEPLYDANNQQDAAALSYPTIYTKTGNATSHKDFSVCNKLSFICIRLFTIYKKRIRQFCNITDIKWLG